MNDTGQNVRDVGDVTLSRSLLTFALISQVKQQQERGEKRKNQIK